MDGTTDLLLPLIHEKEKAVFRYNLDLWRRYSVEISPSQFSITDPTGRSICEHQCSSLYMRKAYFLDESRPRPVGGDTETWCQHQIRSLVDGIYSVCEQKKIVRLVERNAGRRLPKVTQMRVASKYFHVPEWKVTQSPSTCSFDGPAICKPLNNAPIGDFRYLYATKVNLRDLDDGYPWLIQSYIEASYDCTVVYVSGKCFAFSRQKADGEPIDPKEASFDIKRAWDRTDIPGHLERRIQDYMKEVRLCFGRIDFVVANDHFYFLEVNPNGQYAWLDPNNKSGLLSRIVNSIVI